MEQEFTLRRISVPVCMAIVLAITTQAGNSTLPGFWNGVDALAMATRPAILPSEDAVSAATAKVLAAPLAELTLELAGLDRLVNNFYAINPTGGPVRGADPWGRGEFQMPRYDRDRRLRSRHQGIDYAGKPGLPVLAPIGGHLRRVGKGFNEGVVLTGNVNGKKHRVLLLHFQVTAKDGLVAQGQPIGRVKNLSRWYRKMTPHVHMEIHELRKHRRVLKNPTHLVKKTRN